MSKELNIDDSTTSQLFQDKISALRCLRQFVLNGKLYCWRYNIQVVSDWIF